MPEIDKLLKVMQKHGGSDLHVSSNSRPMIRLHGDMTPLKVEPLPSEQVLSLIHEIIPDHFRDQFHQKGDVDFAYQMDETARFRVNAFMDRNGPGTVLRIIPTKIKSAQDLRLPETILNFTKLHKGLVLVTGPTGSGKSTTLAAMIDHINQTRKDHIITVEDPIEFTHPNKKCLVNQREVHRHTNSFHAALRAALREDPDIVLVGEMRDLETTHIAIETAETGHLVFGTLHTTTAASTVDRIIDQFPTNQQGQIRAMLSTSLKGVVAQNLLKKADGTGRVAAIEILIVTSAVSNLIRDGKTFQIPSVMQTGAKFGMVMLNDQLARFVMEGTVAAEEAMGKAVDKRDLAMKLKVAGIDLGSNSEE